MQHIKNLKINFGEYNSLLISADFKLKENQNLILILTDNKNENYSIYGIYDKELKNSSYSVANFIKIMDGNANIRYYGGKFFKYNIKLILQENDNLILLEEIKFDKNKHKFFIILISENDEEIQIWKNYLKLAESVLNIKIDYIINSKSNKQDDIIEISKNKYDIYLKQSEIPLRDNYSSLTIIKTLFDIFDYE